MTFQTTPAVVLLVLVWDRFKFTWALQLAVLVEAEGSWCLPVSERSISCPSRLSRLLSDKPISAAKGFAFCSACGYRVQEIFLLTMVSERLFPSRLHLLLKKE